jgi:hypothetical protein
MQGIACLGVLGLLAVAVALMAWITQLLWNTVLVGVLHIGPSLDYWAALGVYLVLVFVANFFRATVGSRHE